MSKKICERCGDENCRGELNLDSYNGTNGIVIYCRSCGCGMCETDCGYNAIEYECEKYDRYCDECR